MSRENVELVTEVIAPSTGVDLTQLYGDESAWAAIRDSAEPLVEPGCRFTWIALGQGVERIGLDGLREGWLDFFEPWESYFSETEDIVDVGERVLVLTRQRARAPDSDAEVEMLAAGLVEVRDGRIASVEFYANRAEALEVAGVREEDVQTSRP
jgi:ketosteroid isomerase-like protein